jgi:ATP-binding cassette subfamily B protein
MSEGTRVDLRLYGRLLRTARPYWPHIAGILLLSLISTPLILLGPLPLKLVVDSVLGSSPLPGWLQPVVPQHFQGSSGANLVVALALVILITLLLHVRSFLSLVLETSTGEKLVVSFRSALFYQVQRLSLSYHDRKGTTDSTYRIQYDAPAIQWVAVQGFIPLVTSAVTLVGMIWITARIDWELALVALTVTPLLAFVTRFFRRRIRQEWAKLKRIESSTMGVVQEALSMVRVIKAFGQEDRERERFVRHSERSVRERVKLARMNGMLDVSGGAIIAMGTAAALLIGVRHVQAGVLTLGNLLLVMAYLAQLYGPLQTISRKLTDMEASLASAERAFSVLDETRDVAERPNARTIARAVGRVAFEDVSFAYPGGPEVLHRISFEVAPGARVGVTGATGAGKTTLINLLTRFYDPDEGRVLLDGIDLRDYRVADLRRQFAMVLQESVLFSATVGENIAYGRPDAGRSAIIEAATAAHAHDFITALPDGYDTVVGERGMMLSGGERQRVALARAFLRDAPILILDEPTSSVDVGTEAMIVEAMEHLMEGRTAFIIAHRAATLTNCDIRLTMESGHLVALRTFASVAISVPEVRA